MKIISKATLGGSRAAELRARFSLVRRLLPSGLLALFSLMVAAAQAAVPARRPLPTDWGVMVYDDSDFETRAQYTGTLALAESYVAEKFQAVPSTGPRRAYARSVAFGSDGFYFYDAGKTTYVNSSSVTVNNKHHLGWRPFGAISQAAIHADADECGTRAIGNLYLDTGRRLYEGMGFDPLRTLADTATDGSHNMRFVLNWRVNDQHYSNSGPISVSTGQFRAESYAGSVDATNATTGDDNPNLIDEKGGWDWYYDYSKAAVQENRLKLLEEFVDRYADKLDGVELDFQRNNLVLPFNVLQRTSDPGYAANIGHGAVNDALAAEVTAYVRKVRAKLNAVSEAQGRPIYLAVRVPSTIRDCRYLGIFIDDWIQETSYVDGGVTKYHGANGESLVDIVVPTLLYDNSQNIHLNEFITLAHPTGGAPKKALIYTTLHGNMYGYTGARPFTATPPSAYTEKEILAWNAEKPAGTPHPDRDRFIEFQRAGILSYRAMGIDGFEILNYQVYNRYAAGREAWLRDLILDAEASDNDLRAKNRMYSVTAWRERTYPDWYSGGGTNPLPIPSGMRDYPVTPPATFNVMQFANPSAYYEDVTLNIPETIPTSGTTPPPPVYVGLRIALNPSQQPPSAGKVWNTAINLSESFTVKINGYILHEGPLNGGGGSNALAPSVLTTDSTPVPNTYPHADDGPAYVVVPLSTQAPVDDAGLPDKTHYLQMEITAPATVLVNGANTIRLEFGGASTIQVTEITLGIMQN